MGRGLYGQNEGNESRRGCDSMAERIADNELVEGPHVASLRRMFSEADWGNFNRKVDQLRKDGFAETRIQSMINSAQSGVRLNKVGRPR